MSKRKLDVKTLYEKSKALRDIKKKLSNKDACLSYGIFLIQS